jgi:hypothetical protein
VAVEVAAGLDIALGFEVALGFAASVPQSIGRCCSFSQLPLGPFARSAQVHDIAHPAPDEPLLGLVPARGFGAKCAHSVAADAGVSSRPRTKKQTIGLLQLSNRTFGGRSQNR